MSFVSQRIRCDFCDFQVELNSASDRGDFFKSVQVSTWAGDVNGFFDCCEKCQNITAKEKAFAFILRRFKKWTKH